MGQRVRSRKNGKSKGTAIKRSGGSNQNNTVTVGNVTRKGAGKETTGGNKKKVRRKKKGK